MYSFVVTTNLIVARHLPKVTPRFFAEFLDHLSPDRLSLLDLPTCVGLRYGKIVLHNEHFLDN